MFRYVLFASSGRIDYLRKKYKGSYYSISKGFIFLNELPSIKETESIFYLLDTLHPYYTILSSMEVVNGDT